MESSTGDHLEVSVFFLWNWSSVRVPTHLIGSFISKVRTTVIASLDRQSRECAFLVYCDARIMPNAVTREIGKAPNVDILHVDSHDSASGICKKLHRYHMDYDPGIIAIISASSLSYGPIITKLSRCGWRVQLFYPESSEKDFLGYADDSWSVESILEEAIDEVNTILAFPNTAYGLITELDKDYTVESLNNVTEQFESKVIYYNEKAAEAVFELKAFDLESAVSLLEARVRARSPSSGSTTDMRGRHFELLVSTTFLADVHITKLMKAPNDKSPTSQLHQSMVSSINSLDSTLASALDPSFNPYALSSLNFLQQFSLPFRLGTPQQGAFRHQNPAMPGFNAATAAASSQTPYLHHPTTINPYATIQMAAAAAAAQIMQQQNGKTYFNENYAQEAQITHLLPTETGKMDIGQPSNFKDETEEASRTTEKAHNTSANTTEEKLAEDETPKSLTEAKIEVFSEDEDYEVDDETNETIYNETKSGWNEEFNKSAGPKEFTENIIQSCNTMTDYNFPPGYVSEYPALPGSGTNVSQLRYSAVVKGLKPSLNGGKIPFVPLKDCPTVQTHRNVIGQSTPVTQMSQWDQMVVEHGGKFNKPAPQCIHWNNPKHRLDFPCRFWHPREQCRYYPNCTNTADECGFAHPFCADFCRCSKGKRDPQKNHRVTEERYFGGGDRMKYNNVSGESGQ